MKEILIIALLSVVSNLISAALYIVKEQIREYEYRTYIERVQKGEGYSGW